MTKMQRLEVTSLDHAVFYVRDIERSKRFYIDLLGFQVAKEHLEPSAVPPPPEEFDVDIRCFLSCGHDQIGLFQIAEGSAHGGGEYNHLALTLRAGEYDEVRELLEAAGIEIHSRRGDPRCIYVKDPDGHNLQLLTVSEQ
jgi:catechol 2,3-dioxygenase-like lactoylglutathione lyase family enzyme